MIEGATGVRRMLIVAMVLDVAFWAAWFLKPSLVTDVHTDLFIQYEQAFPLGHIVVLCWIVLTYKALGSRQPSRALLWLPCAAGAKGYITGVDILFNLQHHLYATSTPYVVLRIAINILTFGFAVIGLRWTWTHRIELISNSSRLQAMPMVDGPANLDITANRSPT